MLKIKVNEKWEFLLDKSENSNEPFPGWDIVEVKSGIFHMIHDSRSFYGELIEKSPETKEFIFRVNGNRYAVKVRDRYDELLHQLGMDKNDDMRVKDLKAPMPGMVLNISVKEGDSLLKGGTLLVLEAMKMENILKSPGDGVIKKVLVSKGEKVEKNQLLLLME